MGDLLLCCVLGSCSGSDDVMTDTCSILCGTLFLLHKGGNSASFIAITSRSVRVLYGGGMSKRVSLCVCNTY